MSTPSSLVDKTLQLIIKACHPQKVFLFGSAAQETAHSQSDLDFLVIVDDAANTEAIYEKLDHETALKKVDIIVRTASEFEENKTDIAKIDLVVDLEGKLIYRQQ